MAEIKDTCYYVSMDLLKKEIFLNIINRYIISIIKLSDLNNKDYERFLIKYFYIKKFYELLKKNNYTNENIIKIINLIENNLRYINKSYDDLTKLENSYTFIQSIIQYNKYVLINIEV